MLFDDKRLTPCLGQAMRAVTGGNFAGLSRGTFLVVLLGLLNCAPALANPLSADTTSSPVDERPQSDMAGALRILHIGAPSPSLSAASAGAGISIDRAGDLAGRPLALLVKPGSRAPALLGGKPGSGSTRRELSFPGAGKRVTSGYGARWDPLGAGWRSHSGVDLAAAYGTPVVASGNGVVAGARWQGGYGLLVTLDHGGGVETRYAHLSRLSVYEGQQVRKGDVVGFVGSTGRSTGAHLHYEVRENGRSVDPLQ
jgi:murein DD-endopeptidase MepM/ murein hydrolase activator NlpD